MSKRQSAKETALCGTVVLAVWYSAWLAGFGSAVVQTTAAIPVEHPRAALLTVDTERADAPQLAATGNASVANIDGTPAEPETAMATTILAAPDEPNTAAPDEPLMVVAALPDSSQVPAPELPLVQVASTDPSDPAPADVKQVVRRIEILDECLVVDICIDQYLWALYQRPLKEDTNKVRERRKVTVKRKGKMVTVARSFTRLVNQDFTWKDPHAAERVGMPMMDYVIGGMDRSFRTKLFHTLYAAEQAGLSP